jgi:hypothetical protein
MYMNNENCWAEIPARSKMGLRSASWKEGWRADRDGMPRSATGLGFSIMSSKTQASLVLTKKP